MKKAYCSHVAVRLLGPRAAVNDFTVFLALDIDATTEFRRALSDAWSGDLSPGSTVTKFGQLILVALPPDWPYKIGTGFWTRVSEQTFAQLDCLSYETSLIVRATRDGPVAAATVFGSRWRRVIGCDALPVPLMPRAFCDAVWALTPGDVRGVREAREDDQFKLTQARVDPRGDDDGGNSSFSGGVAPNQLRCWHCGQPSSSSRLCSQCRCGVNRSHRLVPNRSESDDVSDLLNILEAAHETD